jgi:3',5'-cyclic-AMP phosphodiesterase
MMKRYTFLILVMLISCSLSAFSPYEIEPVLTLDKDGVSVIVNSQIDIGRVRLYWTFEEDSRKTQFDLFPRYEYFVMIKLPGKKHILQLPFKVKNKKYFEHDLPLNKTIRFRIDAVSRFNDLLSPVQSREIKFKVIKKGDNTPKFGLVFSDPPFIAFTSDSTVRISWETNMKSRASIGYYIKGNKKKKVIKSDDISRRFTIFIKDLQPGTVYNYQVRCIDPETGDELLSPLFNFQTAPQKGKSFRFAVMSCSNSDLRSPDPEKSLNGVNVKTLHRMVCDAYSKNVDFIMFNGDLINGYTDDRGSIALQYQSWKDAVGCVNSYIPIYAVMGDRDSAAPRPKYKTEKDDIFAEEIWSNLFILPDNGPAQRPGLPPYRENVYSFDYAGSHFTVLNSSYNSIHNPKKDERFAHTIDEIQRDWFQLDLEKNKKALLHFVFFHEPPFPCSGYFGASLDRNPDNRDAVCNILDKYRIDMLFNGHEHNYSRIYVDNKLQPNMKNGFWQIISGGAGSASHPQNQKVPWVNLVEKFSRDYHYVIVDVKGKKAVITVFNDKNEVIDRFTVKANRKLK